MQAQDARSVYPRAWVYSSWAVIYGRQVLRWALKKLVAWDTKWHRYPAPRSCDHACWTYIIPRLLFNHAYLMHCPNGKRQGNTPSEAQFSSCRVGTAGQFCQQTHSCFETHYSASETKTAISTGVNLARLISGNCDQSVLYYFRPLPIESLSPARNY